MGLKLHRTGADEYGKFLKVLIAGDPGAGKTRSASTWDHPLIASLGANLMSVADRSINYVDVGSSSDLADLRVMLANPPEVREQIFGFPVNTIVIDTLDHFQEVLVVERKRAFKLAEFGPGDWGWLNDEVAAVVRGFRNLPLHVVFHLHLKLTEDMLSGQVYFKPSLVGQMGDKIAAYVDIALAFKSSSAVDDSEVRQVRRWAQTFSDEQHPWIRDNSGKLPPEFDINFTDDFARLYEAVYSGLDLPASQTRVLDVPQTAGPGAPIEEGLPAKVAGAPTAADVKAAEAKSAKPAVKPAAKAPAKAADAGFERPAQPTTPTPAPEPAAAVSPAVDPEDLAEAALIADLHGGAAPTAEALAAAAATTEMVPCAECGGEVETADQAELSQIRFHRGPMCRKCFTGAKRDLSSTRS